MTHRSRLLAVGFDVPAERHEAEAAFWTAALGGSGRRSTDGHMADVGAPGRPVVFVQRLGTGSSRMHVDVETDDVDAEVARLEALGAGRIERKLKGEFEWWILEDPAGFVFCVVPVFSDDFADGATEWP